MAAIDIDGGVPSTTLNGAITSGATSITLASGASYPDGTNGNFYVVVDLGSATEETIECSARSSNTLTVATRGADGTSAAGHDNGATVQHVVPALTLQEANTHANTTTGTPHGSAYVVPSGNVATATALATARTIVLSGDVSGTSNSFDGSANATITTTIADDSHNHTDSTITGTLSNDTSGNAATATVLATARTIGGVSFNGSAPIDLPGVNTAGNQNTSGNALTATGLAAAVTIGGVSFDGTANINLPGVNTAGTVDTSGTAAVATTATLTDAGTDTTCFPVLAGAATGNEGLETDASALTYNASTGTLSATNLTGTLTTVAQANITSVGTLTGLTVGGAVVIDNDNSGVANEDSLRVHGNHGNSATVTWEDASILIDDVGSYPSIALRSAYKNYAAVLRLSTAAANKLVIRNFNDTTFGDLEVNALTESSDLTLKTKTGAAPGLDLVSRLAPFAGHWTDQPEEVNFWLGAQEVADALTGAGFNPDECGVVQDAEETMGLRYTQLVPVLVKAVQELTARLEAVEG